jgi:hypothetical protein
MLMMLTMLIMKTGEKGPLLLPLLPLPLPLPAPPSLLTKPINNNDDNTTTNNNNNSNKASVRVDRRDEGSAPSMLA